MPTAIDLFSGAGGLSVGLRQAGFNVLAANDFFDAARQTYMLTHPETKFLAGPIENLSASDFLGASGLAKGDLFCLAGGPPCQAFSVYNHQRGMHDQRSRLFLEYLRLVKGLLPHWVALENVTGMTSIGDGDAVEGIESGLRGLGYQVEHKILRAEDYGVPQERRRLVFIGNRIGMPIVWPEATHGPGLKPYVTVRDAISDLPHLANGQKTDAVGYATPPTGAFQRALRGQSDVARNHSAPRLSETNVARMRYIPPGGSWRDLPFDLLPEGMKKAKRSDHTKRYGRMEWHKQSCTILTKCDIHWGAYLHPEQDRAISVREAARIQSFPDSFHFLGSVTDQYVQVGNAVPPLLGQRIGEAILQAESMKYLNAAVNAA